MSILDPELLRHTRFRSQRLLDPVEYVPSLVHHLTAIQAQEHHSAVLAFRPRTSGLTAAGVEHALYEDRTLIRTWLMRGTLHIITAEDLAWMLPLLAPEELRKSQRRLRELDLTPDVLDKALPAITDILRGAGPLTRHEIGPELEARGVSTEGQRIFHLLRYAGLMGALCYGPGQGRDPTYVLLDDWRPLDFLPPDDSSCARLARRYLQACGPASAGDFAYWAGISITVARAAFDDLASDLHEVIVDGDPLWLLPDQAAWLDQPVGDAPHVALIPAYDNYLLGYASRDFMVDAAHAGHIHPGGGVIRPTLLVDGQAAGIWSLRKKGKRRDFSLTPFDTLSSQVRALIDAEAADLARFLNEPVQRVD